MHTRTPKPTTWNEWEKKIRREVWKPVWIVPISLCVHKFRVSTINTNNIYVILYYIYFSHSTSPFPNKSTTIRPILFNSKLMVQTKILTDPTTARAFPHFELISGLFILVASRANHREKSWENTHTALAHHLIADKVLSMHLRRWICSFERNRMRSNYFPKN